MLYHTDVSAKLQIFPLASKPCLSQINTYFDGWRCIGNHFI